MSDDSSNSIFFQVVFQGTGTGNTEVMVRTNSDAGAKVVMRVEVAGKLSDEDKERLVKGVQAIAGNAIKELELKLKDPLLAFFMRGVR